MDNTIDIDELSDSRNILKSTYGAAQRRGQNLKIEPWTLTIRDVLDFVPVSKVTIYTWIKLGYFPKSIDSKSQGRSLWRMKDVLGFLDMCIANDKSYADHMKSKAPK